MTIASLLFGFTVGVVISWLDSQEKPVGWWKLLACFAAIIITANILSFVQCGGS